MTSQMIMSSRDDKTERFARGQNVKEFSGFARQAELRLDRLEIATSLKDLAALRGNRLEALAGDRLCAVPKSRFKSMPAS